MEVIYIFMVRTVSRPKAPDSGQSEFAETAVNFHLSNLVNKLGANEQTDLSSSIQRIRREPAGFECANRRHVFKPTASSTGSGCRLGQMGL